MITEEKIDLFNDTLVNTMEKTIHIFDLDDTVLETPTFGTFVGVEDRGVIDTNKYYPGYFEKVKSAFWDVLSKEISLIRMNDFVVPINNSTKKPFDADVLDYFQDRKYKRMFEDHDGIMVLKSFPGFHSDPNTLGKRVNDAIINDYKSAKNKMILTGRDKELADLIKKRLDDLGMDQPNYGIHTYKSGKFTIEEYKIMTILQSIKDFGWTCIHFYEDRKDWLENAMETTKEIYPAINFHAHLITNVKEKMRL